MKYSLQAIEDLNRQFDASALPAAEWTHEAHLLVGLYHLLHYGRDESIIRLRSRIITMNHIQGTPNSATRGYHETITLFWVWVLETYIQQAGATHHADVYQKFLDTPLSRADLLFRFYSRERLFSVQARANWVEPDRLPLTPELLFED